MKTVYDSSQGCRRIYFWGLAKNTGKTVSMRTVLAEARAAGRSVAITSVGRDGEERDAINRDIRKPRIALSPGVMFATTRRLIEAYGTPARIIERTGVRTPLGNVVIAEMKGSGLVELAGPGRTGAVRAVCEQMERLGADLVLVDGALDRRAAAAPALCDGVILATGAVLGYQERQVIKRTVDAAALAQVTRTRLAAPQIPTGAGGVIIDSAGRALPFPSSSLYSGTCAWFAELAGELRAARSLWVAGALVEPFLAKLREACSGRQTALPCVVEDFTRLFVRSSGLERQRRSVSVQVRTACRLVAVTTNPVAPCSHQLSSGSLVRGLRDTLPGIPVFDVMAQEYPAASQSSRPIAAGDRAAAA